MNELFHNMEDGDEIFFLPNPYTILTNDNIGSIIEKTSTPYFISIECLYLKETFLFNNSLFDQEVFSILRKLSIHNKDKISYIKRQYSFVFINNEVKIIKFGQRIADMLVREVQRNDGDVIGFNNIKKFNVRKKMTSGFPNFDRCFFSIDNYKSPFQSMDEYENYIKIHGLKGHFNKFYENNMIQKKIKLLNDFLTQNNFTMLLDNPHYKKYIRTLKLNEVFENKTE